VAEIRSKYGITDDDTFNFDETGFAMGIAIPGSSKVVTTSSVGRATTMQPGDRQWSTGIECINALGYAIPPFIILEGKVHQSTWYSQNPDIPPDWTIAVSDNGWTTDELGMEFIRHFDRWTKNRVVGQYRLLILDGHGSHATPEFETYCSENKIITLCMPPHTSHILQPLDVACFSPFKQAYSRLVQDLARQGIFHVDKADFLGMYHQARTAIFTPQNIASGFRATGLIPFNPDRVLSTLTFTKTPSPPPTSHGQNSSPWTSETPRNLAQLDKQLQLVQDSLQRLSKSPTEPLAKVAKGCKLAMSGAALLRRENQELRAANERLQRKKRQRRSYIQHGGVLQVQDARNIITAVGEPIEHQDAEQDQQPQQRAPPTCSNCHIQGHRMTSCKQPRRIR
jgi:DDE superfamily endonuclease